MGKTKTRKIRKTSPSSAEKKVATLLGFLDTVKLYHWRTRHYSDHKSTDKLYESLNDSIDLFVESLLGASGHKLSGVRTIPVSNVADTEAFRREALRFKQTLTIWIPSCTTDLVNIIDDMRVAIDQFLFLSHLDK
jgi:DNA-binding ferritin-like protein